MNDLFKSIASAHLKLHTEQQELAAIWLDKSIQTPFGRTVRVIEGTMLKIVDGKLVDYSDEPTHKVIACFGTLNDQFEITVINLKTNEPEQIKL